MFFEWLVQTMNHWSPEYVWGLVLLFCFGSIVFMFRTMGHVGLYVFIAVAMIGASIQVMKQVQFSVYAHPIPLGTILFSSTYLCTDILAEYYGRDAARRGVMVGFIASLLFAVLMLLTMGYRPLSPDDGIQQHMVAIFMQTPALFCAGMTAYLISQYNDVWIFLAIKRLTRGHMLWLRNNVSTCVSGFIDNCIFSFLAFRIFAPHPVAWDELWFSYILGTYGLRVAISLLQTPFMYLTRVLKPDSADIKSPSTKSKTKG